MNSCSIRIVVFLMTIILTAPVVLASGADSPEASAPIEQQALRKSACPVLSGQGAHDVVMVSDPFCPFCRRSMRLVMRKKADVKTFSLILHPLAFHPGADTACRILAHVRDTRPDKLLAAIIFAHGGLKIPQTSDQEQADKNVIRSFMKKFPWLTHDSLEEFAVNLHENYAESVAATMHKARENGVTSIPVVLVDDNIVVGYRPKQLGSFLKK